jgi:hypothetical protein
VIEVAQPRIFLADAHNSRIAFLTDDAAAAADALAGFRPKQRGRRFAPPYPAAACPLLRVLIHSRSKLIMLKDE